MEKLFIDKTININASRQTVWDVLTRRDYTNRWVGESLPGMRVESDWHLGSLVLWKELNGRIVIEGNVAAVDQAKLLQFTVFDADVERPVEAQEGGITFELAGRGKKMTLHVLHGDFSALPEGKKYYGIAVGLWENILPKIKKIAEDRTKSTN